MNGPPEAPDAGAADGRDAAPASLFALRFLCTLVQRGVSDVVVCPGSRSQALALVAAELERAGAISLHVRVDERSAAFFALGLARETGVPAPVIVTSGTAVANLAPAALEAHEGRVPMLLLTADRPRELRGIRSSQATRQAGLFDGVARLSVDVEAPGRAAAGTSVIDDVAPVVAPGGEAAWVALAEQAIGADSVGALVDTVFEASRGALDGPPPGPVQVNIALRDPLSGFGGLVPKLREACAAAGEAGRRERASQRAAAERNAAARAERGDHGRRDAPAASRTPQGWSAPLESERLYSHSVAGRGPRAVVVAGEGAGPDAAAFARAAGLPLLAEVVSGARLGDEAIVHYARLLDDPALGGRVERVVVFGHPTLTRQVAALLRRDDVEAVVVDPHAGPGIEHFDPGLHVGRPARVVAGARVDRGADEPEAEADGRGRRWLEAWIDADRKLRGGRQGAPAARLTRDALVSAAWSASRPQDRLFVAASRLVRSLDALADGRPVEVRSNRGLAGIDGTVATALGIEAARRAGAADPAFPDGLTRVIVGDLALLHDAGSLLLTEGEPRPRVQLVVGNDGGGTIFDGLEVAASADPEAFDRVMLTPQRVDLRGLALAYGWGYRRATTRAELDAALQRPADGPEVVEVPLAR